MKNITSLSVRPGATAAIILASNTNVDRVQRVVRAAIASVEESRQKCLLAGQMLFEVQKGLATGQFDVFVQTYLPEISVRTAYNWAKAAGNVAKALPQYIDVESSLQVSGFLTLPDAELTDAQLKYKQAWFDFTENRTIKECLSGVFVDGNDAVSAARAINGKTKGGVGMQPDRKAFEKFTATKLKHITSFLTVQTKAAGTGQKRVTGWRELGGAQKTAISAAFIQFLQTAPAWLLDNLADQIKLEARMSDAERLSR
jgi:hypothetical protein